jgi:hypothetical protein
MKTKDFNFVRIFNLDSGFAVPNIPPRSYESRNPEIWKFIPKLTYFIES